MRAASALLSDIESIIKVNGMIGTGIDAILTAGTLYGVDNHQPIVSLVDSVYRTRRYAGSIPAMVAKRYDVGHFNFRNRPPDIFRKLQPELSGLWFRFGIRGPVIGYVLILTGNLAVITTVASRDIKGKDLQFTRPVP
jgi:hypothetical protein